MVVLEELVAFGDLLEIVVRVIGIGSIRRIDDIADLMDISG